MKTLLNNVKTVISGLIGSAVFDDPDGGTQTMRYYVGEMPDKGTVGNEKDFPFCLITPGSFKIDREGRNQDVNIVFGLYEAGDKADALTMIDGLLSTIATAPSVSFSGYKLISELSGDFTDNYPYYEISITGEFRKAR